MSDSVTTATPAPAAKPTSPKFWPAFLLCMFLGCFGAHRFYLKSPRRVLMLCTLGGFGLWALVDCVTILLGKFKDEAGALIPNPKPAVSWAVFALCVAIGMAGQNTSGTGSGDAEDSDSSSYQSSTPSVVGSYSGDLGTGTVTYIFKSDGTFSFIGRDGVSRGRWSQSGSSVTIRSDYGTATYSVMSNGRRLGNSQFWLSRD